ncbi:MAG: phage holin family protein [Polyangiaceae bacterium]|nr:phage holin family protein [Polyangiaceae bacterium]
MAAGAPRIRALLDLWAAHRELSQLEWLEFRQAILLAAAWLVCAAAGGLAGWLALNAAVVMAFREQPLNAALGVVAVNLLGATIAGLQVRRLLRRPFFALTQRETARDVAAILKAFP